VAILDKLTFICGILAVVSFIATAILLSLKSINENIEHQNKIEVIGASIFVGSFVLVFAFAYIIHKSALADLKLFIETEPERIQVIVNDEHYENGKPVVTAIHNIRPQMFDADLVSNNEDNVKFVSLVKGDRRVNLRLVQHGECREYYVYYPVYLTTNKNPLGLMNFW
jgi:hypothetical protein